MQLAESLDISKNNPGQGIFFDRNSELQILGCSDVGYLDSRLSTSGYCFFLSRV